MPKPSTRVEVNNFVKGLITEASPLNFPSGASLDEINFELNRNGTRNRRLGLGYEDFFNYIGTGHTKEELKTLAISTFKWVNVNGSPSTEFLVVQVNTTLLFFDLLSTVISNTTTSYKGAVYLADFPSGVKLSFSSIEGSLVVAGGSEYVALITYKDSVFGVVYDRLQVRDVWGVEVKDITQYETDDSYRGGFSINHYYNLQNQSWGIPRKKADGSTEDAIAIYSSAIGVLPSNSEVVWTGLQFQPVTGGVTFERVYPNLYSEVLGADVIASKGYYIIDLLRRGQSRSDQLTINTSKYPENDFGSFTPPLDYTPGGPKVVTEYSGRVWYAGFSGQVIGGDSRSPDLSNFLCFSQLVRNKSDISKCYQSGDPTSRENNDLVDTDGGFVRISGAKNIIGLLNLESSLIVVAENGVWSVTGGNDYGFSATNYKVTRISSFGGLDSSSLVVEGGRAYFWSSDGIYVIGKDNLGTFGVINITQTTIQTLYDNIPTTSKKDAVGEYDAVNKKIRWIYKTGVRFSELSVTHELIFDTVLNAFYQNKISNVAPNSAEVISLFSTSPILQDVFEEPVYSGLELVYSDADPVSTSQIAYYSNSAFVKYLVFQVIGGLSYFTFAQYNNEEFLDFKDVNGVGVDAKAYLLTGQVTGGDSAIAKQMPYLVMYFERTEFGVTSDYVPAMQSGCFMRCQWDFSNTIVSKKWSPLVQVYRYRRARYVEDLSDTYDNGFEIISSKNKVRGRGKAFSLYLETEPLKDCRVLGWSMSLNGNSVE